MSKYKIFIPEHLRAYRPRPLRWLGKFLMKVTGWKTTGHLPKDQRVVLIAGPHTSNWDFVLAMSLILSLDVHIHWVGKHSIFKKGFRRLLRKMGGIPVNRANPEALKNEIYNVTEKYKGFIIAIAPEGTRKKVERLKSGFLRIANETYNFHSHTRSRDCGAYCCHRPQPNSVPRVVPRPHFCFSGLDKERDRTGK